MPRLFRVFIFALLGFDAFAGHPFTDSCPANLLSTSDQGENNCHEAGWTDVIPEFGGAVGGILQSGGLMEQDTCFTGATYDCEKQAGRGGSVQRKQFSTKPSSREGWVCKERKVNDGGIQQKIRNYLLEQANSIAPREGSERPSWMDCTHVSDQCDPNNKDHYCAYGRCTQIVYDEYTLMKEKLAKNWSPMRQALALAGGIDWSSANTIGNGINPTSMRHPHNSDGLFKTAELPPISPHEEKEVVAELMKTIEAEVSKKCDPSTYKGWYNEYYGSKKKFGKLVTETVISSTSCEPKSGQAKPNTAGMRNCQTVSAGVSCEKPVLDEKGEVTGKMTTHLFKKEEWNCKLTTRHSWKYDRDDVQKYIGEDGKPRKRESHYASEQTFSACWAKGQFEEYRRDNTFPKTMAQLDLRLAEAFPERQVPNHRGGKAEHILINNPFEYTLTNSRDGKLKSVPSKWQGKYMEMVNNNPLLAHLKKVDLVDGEPKVSNKDMRDAYLNVISNIHTQVNRISQPPSCFVKVGRDQKVAPNAPKGCDSPLVDWDYLQYTGPINEYLKENKGCCKYVINKWNARDTATTATSLGLAAISIGVSVGCGVASGAAATAATAVGAVPLAIGAAAGGLACAAGGNAYLMSIDAGFAGKRIEIAREIASTSIKEGDSRYFETLDRAGQEQLFANIGMMAAPLAEIPAFLAVTKGAITASKGGASTVARVGNAAGNANKLPVQVSKGAPAKDDIVFGAVDDSARPSIAASPGALNEVPGTLAVSPGGMKFAEQLSALNEPLRTRISEFSKQFAGKDIFKGVNLNKLIDEESVVGPSGPGSQFSIVRANAQKAGLSPDEILKIESGLEFSLVKLPGDDFVEGVYLSVAPVYRDKLFKGVDMDKLLREESEISAASVNSQMEIVLKNAREAGMPDSEIALIESKIEMSAQLGPAMARPVDSSMIGLTDALVKKYPNLQLLAQKHPGLLKGVDLDALVVHLNSGIDGGSPVLLKLSGNANALTGDSAQALALMDEVGDALGFPDHFILQTRVPTSSVSLSPISDLASRPVPQFADDAEKVIAQAKLKGIPGVSVDEISPAVFGKGNLIQNMEDVDFLILQVKAGEIGPEELSALLKFSPEDITRLRSTPSQSGNANAWEDLNYIVRTKSCPKPI